MRNLINFLNKYSFFLFFLLLEVIAFFLIVQNNQYQKASFINSANSVSGEVYESFNQATEYLSLKKENSRLAAENALLRENQLSSYAEVFGDNVVVNDTIYGRKYHYMAAKIINNSVNTQNNYLTLDKGSLNGIERGMGVIASQGVVGIVKNVSSNYSVVLSILHSQSSISGRLKNSSYFGSVKWDGRDYRNGKLTDIPNHVNLRLGDTITTSGFSSIFPANIPIGTVLDYERIEGENFYDIDIRYMNDMKSMKYVYIVKNLHQEEIIELEEIIQPKK